jgi:hypothetical protein
MMMKPKTTAMIPQFTQTLQKNAIMVMATERLFFLAYETGDALTGMDLEVSIEKENHPHQNLELGNNKLQP